MIQSFNHSMMELAREAAGLSQEALAKAIGCTQATISRWEHGLFRPSEEELSKLCEAMNVPASFFTREDNLLGGGLPVFYHRSLAAAPAKSTAQVNARCFVRAMQIETLYKMCPLPQHEFPVLSTDRFKNGAVDVAAAVRASWKIGPGPIQNLVKLLELKGGIVIVEDLGCDEVDALCWWRSGLPRLFFVNARKPACRMRFSLAHELGHTVMHTEPTDTRLAEQEADAFAGEFLMPASQARSCLYGPLNLARIAALKPWWKMSMAAIAVRGKDCGAIGSDQLSSLMKEMGSRGWRKREPVDVPTEHPTVFGQMLRHPLDKLGWSIDELASVLHTTVVDLQRLLGSTISVAPERSGEADAPSLRLVGF